VRGEKGGGNNSPARKRGEDPKRTLCRGEEKGHFASFEGRWGEKGQIALKKGKGVRLLSERNFLGGARFDEKKQGGLLTSFQIARKGGGGRKGNQALVEEKSSFMEEKEGAQYAMGRRTLDVPVIDQPCF